MTGAPAAARRGRAAADLALALGVAASIVACLLVQGGVWERVGGGDLHGTYLPKYEAAAHAVLARHRLPLWNPYEFCGLPLLGVGHGAVLYPPTWVAFGFLPRWQALQAFYAFHVVLLAYGAILYLRRHGIGLLGAAIVPAVAVAGLFGAPSRAGYDHPSFLASVAWLPWMLLAAERAATDGGRRWLGLLALATCAQWLAGYPDFPLDSAVLVAIVTLVGVEAPLARKVGVVALGLGLGAALAAAQILPLAEAVSQSPRAGQDDFYAGVRGILAVGSADTFVNDLVERQGLAALLLAIGSALAPSRMRLGWAVALVWALFALNRPFVWLYRLPPFTTVRFALGWSGLAPVLLGLLAAATIDAGWRRGAWTRRLVVLLALVAMAQSSWLITTAPLHMAHPAPDLRRVGRRVAELRKLGLGSDRFVGAAELAAGAPLRYGLASPSGYEPSLPPRRIVRLLDAAALSESGLYRPQTWPRIADNAPLSARLGIGWLVAPPAAAGGLMAHGFEMMGTVEGGEVAVRQAATPRARLVHRVTVVDDEDASFAEVVRQGADADVAVLERGEPEPRLGVPTGAEKATIVESEPERVVVDVEAAADAMLVVTDTFYPGWTARVGDRPAPIRRVDFAFRGVDVPAGRTRVQLRYAPRSVRVGLGVSLLALVIALGLVAARRRAPAAPTR